MTGKTAKEFSKKTRAPRLYLYSVSVRTNNTRKKNYANEAAQMVETLKQLAAEKGFADKVSFNPEESMAKIGILFMKAPEKFAALVRKVDGIQYVEKPADRKLINPALRR